MVQINYQTYATKLEDKQWIDYLQDVYQLSVYQSCLLVAIERAYHETDQNKIVITASGNTSNLTRSLNSLVKQGFLGYCHFNKVTKQYRISFKLVKSFDYPEKTFKSISIDYNDTLANSSSADDHYQQEVFMLSQANYNPKHSGYKKNESENMYYPPCNEYNYQGYAVKDNNPLYTLQMTNGYCIYPKTNK